MSVLIHIGYHKTGSTWLQNEVFKSGHPVFEPLSDSKKQNLFAWNFWTDREGYLLNSFDLNETHIRGEMKKIISEKAKDENKMWVLSHERLSGDIHSGGFDSLAIAQRIHRIFPDGKILIMIREQGSFILSSYLQYLSIGGNHGLKKYIDTSYDARRPGFSVNHFMYHRLIETYHDLFGKDNVLVLPYELFSMDKPLFFEKLSQFTGQKIEVPHEEGKEVFHNKKRNQFLSYHLRFLNRFIKSTSVNNYSRLMVLPGKLLAMGIIGGLGIFIPNAVNKSLLNRLERRIRKFMGDRYVESNRITNDLIETDLEEYGYF